jgi:DNA-binding LytR/AlgR family response regulator
MGEIKAVIADDEVHLRQYLRQKLQVVWPELQVAGEAGNGTEALALIERLQPQVAFLDIRMPGLTGLQVTEKITGVACRIVFVTAYDAYAVDAFEKEAVDYLLKPVSHARLEITVARLKEQLESDAALPVNAIRRILSRLVPDARAGFLQYIHVQHGDEIRLIAVNDVIYYKAQDKYTSVMTREREYLIRKTIKELAEELDPQSFWQIHRGTIVRVSAIARVGRSLTGKGVVRLKDSNETLMVSSRYMHLFKQM